MSSRIFPKGMKHGRAPGPVGLGLLVVDGHEDDPGAVGRWLPDDHQGGLLP